MFLPLLISILTEVNWMSPWKCCSNGCNARKWKVCIDGRCKYHCGFYCKCVPGPNDRGKLRVVK